MARKIKKKRVSSEGDAKKDIQKSFKEFNWRLLGKLLLSFTVIFGLYVTLLKVAEINRSFMMQDIVMIVYSSVTTIVLCIFIVLNRGISKDIPTKEQLNQKWSDEEKTEFIESYVKSKEKAKKWLIILIPLLFTLLFDMMYLILFVK